MAAKQILISGEVEEAEYYLFNAHGDVVNLTDSTGTVTKSYDYDAFGNEVSPDAADENPFRYCGEYWDPETATYYLRARYYAPSIGRFTQQDTHWNTANMIYGDNPQKINEREDKLGLKTYSYAPQISAIAQSGNLYVYGLSNPVLFCDPTGEIAFFVIAAIVGAAIGAIAGGIIAANNGTEWWKGALVGAGIGGAGGALAGVISSLIASAAIGGVSATLSASEVWAGLMALLNGGTAATLWGVSKDGINQGIKHFFNYMEKYPNRMSRIAMQLGEPAFDATRAGFARFTAAAMNVVQNYQQLGGLCKQIGQKAIYYYNDVIIILYDGKLQTVMIGSWETFNKMQ